MIRKLFSGGIAGMIVWTFCYPADAIKTRMQTNDGKRLKFFNVAREVVGNNGI